VAAGVSPAAARFEGEYLPSRAPANASAESAAGVSPVFAPQALLSGPEAAAAVEFLGLTPEAAKTFILPTIERDMRIETADVQKILDSMHKTGMLPDAAKADDMVDNLAK